MIDVLAEDDGLGEAVGGFEKRGDLAGDNRVRDDLRQTAAEVGRLEDVFEDAPDVQPRAFVGIDAERAMPEVQGAYVVKPEDVIGVTVRDEHRVKPLQLLAQRLLPKIRRSIHEHRLPVVLDEHGDAQTFVARIIRCARLALAADGRHARRSACAE